MKTHRERAQEVARLAGLRSIDFVRLPGEGGYLDAATAIAKHTFPTGLVKAAKRAGSVLGCLARKRPAPATGCACVICEIATELTAALEAYEEAP